MIFGPFRRLTTRLNLIRLDVAAARSDFAFSVCLGILEFSELGHRRFEDGDRTLAMESATLIHPESNEIDSL